MPEPFVPSDLDLRDFPNMPLDVVRLRDSDLSVTATGDEFRAAILLWCCAWHQLPASSLPDDDRMLARYAGYGRDLKGWQKIRETALHGFVKCSDGRFYHPVIGDMALKADAKRRGNTRRTAAATAAAAAARKTLRERADSRDDIRYGRNDGDRRGTQEKRSEGNGREIPVVDEAREPGKSVFSEGDFDLTQRILKAQGLDKGHPSSIGATYFANKWRSSGWQPDLIVTTIERVMSKRSKAPNNLRYFEQAIADAHAELARPLPEGTAGPPRPARPQSAAELYLQLDDQLNGATDANDPARPDYSAGPGVILDA
jgi:hypothetical protein